MAHGRGRGNDGRGREGGREGRRQTGALWGTEQGALLPRKLLDETARLNTTHITLEFLLSSVQVASTEPRSQKKWLLSLEWDASQSLLSYELLFFIRDRSLGQNRCWSGAGPPSSPLQTSSLRSENDAAGPKTLQSQKWPSSSSMPP